MGHVDVRCRHPGCGAKLIGYRQCPVKGCMLEVGMCIGHGGDDTAIEWMRAHIASHQPMSSTRWTGPTLSDRDPKDATKLAAPVPPERWPYGTQEMHQEGCALFAVGLFCDCAASAADQPEFGELA